MRNLKRALSLTLASVMLLGMMVVGAGAAGYKDVTDGHNVEAIEVLQAVGAMVGDEAGNFDPDANVNRAQIATIMSRLLDLKVEDFNAADIPFTDVPEWAVPFVAACYADGITSGISDTAYGSNNSVTAVQAALMMMKALGYFQYQEDFEQDWQLATLKKASEIGLLNGITVDRTSALTRNDVAQMALNALKSNMVSFTGNVGSTYPVNGETVRVGYKPEYTPQTSADAIYNRIDVGTTNIAEDDRYYVQLGEYLYGGDLRLTSDIDVFGRPARHWEFEGTDIGTYVKEELLREQYTAGVTGKTIFDLLGRSMIQDSELFVYVDGDERPTTLDLAGEIDKNDLVRSNTKSLSHTSRGVLTQVFVDTQNMEITIAIINTYLAQATTAYSEKNESISLKVYNTGGSTVKTVSLADVPEIQGLANGDWMLVYMSNMDTANNVYRVVEVMDVEIVADVEIDEFSTKKDDKNDNYYNDGDEDHTDYVNTIVVGEDTYSRAYKHYYDPDVLKEYNDSALEDAKYNIYLDLYGNFIGVDLSEGTKNYVFIAGYDLNGSNITNRTANALAIFPDGTMDEIKVNVQATNKNINNMTPNKNIHTDTYADVYHEWQSGRYTHAYGQKNNPTVNNNEDGNVENLWYTYRVTDKGVYTLTPVSNFTIDGWDGNDDDTTRNTIRTDSVSLWHQNNETPRNSWGNTRSYGNTDSVYIVGSNDDNDFNNQVVSSVDGLYTSVDKVNITYQEPTGNNLLTAGWANAVVDGDGYVVAAVILGEAEGAVDNYAYILKGAYAERYDRTTGTTYHKFDVYMNGEIKTLTTKDTYEDTVPNIKVNHVQELVMDADGMVTRVRDIPNAGCGILFGEPSQWQSHFPEAMLPGSGHDVACLGENANYKNFSEDKVFDHMEAINGTRITDYSVYYMDTDKVLSSTTGEDSLDLYFKGDTLYMKANSVVDLDKAGLFVAKDAPALLIDADGEKTEFATAKDAYSNIVDADDTAAGLQFNGHVAAALDSTGKAVWVVFYDETENASINDRYDQKVDAKISFPDNEQAFKDYTICPDGRYAGIDKNGRLGFEFYLRDHSRWGAHARSAASENGYSGLIVRYTVYNNGVLTGEGSIYGDWDYSVKHPNEWHFAAVVSGNYKVDRKDTVTVRIHDVTPIYDNTEPEPTGETMFVNVTYTANNTEVYSEYVEYSKADATGGFITVTADAMEKQAVLATYNLISGTSGIKVPFVKGSIATANFKVEAKSQTELDKDAVAEAGKTPVTPKSKEETQKAVTDMVKGTNLGASEVTVETKVNKDGVNEITVTGTFNSTGADWVSKLGYGSGFNDQEQYLIAFDVKIPDGAEFVKITRSDGLLTGKKVSKADINPLIVAVEHGAGPLTLTLDWYRTEEAARAAKDVKMGTTKYIIIDKTGSNASVDVDTKTENGTTTATVDPEAGANAVVAANQEGKPLTLTVDAPESAKTVKTELPGNVVDALKLGKTKQPVVVDIPGVATVQVPVEALEEVAADSGKSVTIVVDAVEPIKDQTDTLPGEAEVALSFNVTLEDANGEEVAVSGLKESIKLTFPIPEEYKDAPVIKLFYFDEANKKYELVESEIVGGSIVADVNHLTEFAVVSVMPKILEFVFKAAPDEATTFRADMVEKYGVDTWSTDTTEGPKDDPNVLIWVAEWVEGAKFQLEYIAPDGTVIGKAGNANGNVITVGKKPYLRAWSFENSEHNPGHAANPVAGTYTIKMYDESGNTVLAEKTVEVKDPQAMPSLVSVGYALDAADAKKEINGLQSQAEQDWNMDAGSWKAINDVAGQTMWVLVYGVGGDQKHPINITVTDPNGKEVASKSGEVGKAYMFYFTFDQTNGGADHANEAVKAGVYTVTVRDNYRVVGATTVEITEDQLPKVEAGAPDTGA